MVKQSAALNRPGVENMKPRQLADAIHQEIGNVVTSQISDNVWKIIRSGDGMKAEITETVQSVYNKLLNPKVNECGESSHQTNSLPVWKEHENNRSLAASTSEVAERLSNGEPNEPPGFSMRDHSQNNNTDDQHDLPKESHKKLKSYADKTREEPIQETYHFGDRLEPSRVSKSPPPGTSEAVEQKQSDDVSDDDPDVPPGFG